MLHTLWTAGRASSHLPTGRANFTWANSFVVVLLIVIAVAAVVFVVVVIHGAFA